MIVRLNFIRAGLFHLFSDGLSVKGSYTTEKQAIWRFITSKNPDQWLQTSVGSVADVTRCCRKENIPCVGVLLIGFTHDLLSIKIFTKY